MASYHRSVSPDRRYSASYDRYVPPYDPPHQYRDNHPTSYPHPYPDGPGTSSYPPAPPPGRYYHDYDDRSRGWSPSSPSSPVFSHPRPSGSRSRGQSSTMAAPMLEPSESWRESHGESSYRSETDWYRGSAGSSYYPNDNTLDRSYPPSGHSYDLYPQLTPRTEANRYRPRTDSRASRSGSNRSSSPLNDPRSTASRHYTPPPRSPTTLRRHSPPPARSPPVSKHPPPLRSSPIITTLPTPQFAHRAVLKQPLPPPEPMAHAPTTAPSTSTAHSRLPREPPAQVVPIVKQSPSRSSIASSIASSRQSTPVNSTTVETQPEPAVSALETALTSALNAKSAKGKHAVISRPESLGQSRQSSVGLDLPSFGPSTSHDPVPDNKTIGEPAPSKQVAPVVPSSSTHAKSPGSLATLGEQSLQASSSDFPGSQPVSNSSVPTGKPVVPIPSSFREDRRNTPLHPRTPLTTSTTAQSSGHPPPVAEHSALSQPSASRKSVPTINKEADTQKLSPKPKESEPMVDRLPCPRSTQNLAMHHQDEPLKIEERPSAVLLSIDYEQSTSVPRTIQEADNLSDALSFVVDRRARDDSMTRENRVDPVIRANLLLSIPSPDHSKSNELDSIFQIANTNLGSSDHSSIKMAIQHRLAGRAASHNQKLEDLEEEYLDLRLKWMAQCAAMDKQAKVLAAEQELQPVAATGRTTRRSTALMGDLVRSDLEYEQILASLGNDELTDPAKLCKANLATIPDLLSVSSLTPYVYDDTNNLVADPQTYFEPRTGLHDWTEEEKLIYQEKFAQFPKQFGLIAEHLPGKTTRQCVDFYYLHKKVSIDFRKVITKFGGGRGSKGRGGRLANRKGSTLMKDIRQHDAEVSKTTTPKAPAKRRGGASASASDSKRTSRRAAAQFDDTSTGASTPEPENNKNKRKRGSAAASEDKDEPAVKKVKRPARITASRKPKAPAVIVEESVEPALPTPPPDDPPPRPKPTIQPSAVIWSEEDRSAFFSLVAQHGEDFKTIAARMANKTTIQVANFYHANAPAAMFGAR